MTALPAHYSEPRPKTWDALPLTLPAALLAAPPDTPIIYLDAQGQANTTCYRDLISQASRVAQGWHAQGVPAGQKVILQLSTSQDILTAFWGCLFAGLEPVIVPIPVSFEMQNRPLDQLNHLYVLLDSPLICTTPELALNLTNASAAPALISAKCLALEDLLQSDPIADIHRADPHDIAFYTLSSGSTGLSKAVSLTHQNMISRGRGSNALCGNVADDVILSWLPFDHIGNISAYHVSPILAGSTLVYAPKEYILAKPLRWLDLIEQYQVTHGWAPNFAFGLVTKALKNNTQRWDLSSVKGLLSAGELIAHSTCEDFLAAVETFGFARHALISAFGMAEVCSGVAYHLPAKGQSIRFEHLDRRHLQDDFKTVSVDDPQCISFASLGPIVPGMAMRIVDDNNEHVLEGVPGRFQIKGDALMPGYYRNDQANKAFMADGWFDTGDSGFIRHGELYLMGRSGLGIVINGVNLSNAEIETVVESIDAIEPSYTAACGVFAPGTDKLQLAVFFYSSQINEPASLTHLLKSIQAGLSQQVGVRADFLIPLDRADIPKTAIGKIQHKRLAQRFQAGDFDAIVSATQALMPSPAPRRSDASSSLKGLAAKLADIWQEVLNQPEVGRDDNFFELGGDSLALMQALELTNEVAQSELSLVDLFRFPSIGALVAYIEGDGTSQKSPTQAGQERAQNRKDHIKSNDIAVIGMSCRFPGADNLADFWHNLSNGVESITFFDDDSLDQSGFAKSVYAREGYVKASPLLSDVRGFDAEFFGYSARDAELMDPQHRLFLECSWEAFEDAGYDPTTYPGSVGVYAGAAMNTYLFNNVLPNRHELDPQDDLSVMTLDSMGGFMAMVANDKDYLTTRVSYKLNLSGPSVNVQTACSTGLVAIHMACQSLATGEADLFLAGGASVQSPEQAGHLYQPGMIVTPDGHVRSFDAQAGGTIFGSGVGAVLLKRLDDALRDADHIYAVVKGSAVNNDAGMKVGYMAPSSDGQAVAVAEALAVADVPAHTIGLVEAHGTGTVVGDPIEVNGLTQVYRSQTDQTGYCALGSVKTNVGHLQITSGTAGFIKSVLAVNHGIVPPMVNFETPNPALQLETTPFFINKKAVPWPVAQGPRRAAVNSLGIGGTNAHAILEQAPLVTDTINAVERPSHLMLLSARSEAALQAMAMRYINHLGTDSAPSFPNACFTANTGRKRFAHRLTLWATDTNQATEQLQAFVNKTTTPRLSTHQIGKAGATDVAFLFTGQGSQFIGMAAPLYDTQVVFKEQLEICAQLFEEQGIYRETNLIEAVTRLDFDSLLLNQTGLAQPAIFSVGYALARMWQSWGVNPSAVMGHSLGEYIAACVAGVFSLPDAVRLVAARARLMQALPADGEMWAVSASAAYLAPYLSEQRQHVTMAADNAPDSVVLSGDRAHLTDLIERLQASHVTCQKLNTSHAFHSPLMAPMLEAFAAVANSVTYHVPAIAMVSNVSGMRAAEEITMPAYWREHVLQPVLFRQGIDVVVNELGCDVLLEVGVRPTLTGLGMQCLPTQGQWLTSQQPGKACWESIMTTAAELALRDAINLKDFDLPYKRRRVALPTYPFEHVPYWLTAPLRDEQMGTVSRADRLLGQRLNIPSITDSVFQNRFDTARQQLLNDHLILGQPVASAACHVSMMLQAVRESQQIEAVTLQDLIFERPLLITKNMPRDVQVVVHQDEQRLSVTSFRTGSDGLAADLQTHAQARWETGASAPATLTNLDDVLARCPTNLAVEHFLQRQQARQITLGPSYQWPTSIHQGDGEVLTLVKAPKFLPSQSEDSGLHPGLLDACFGALLSSGVLPENSTWLPFAMETVQWLAEPPNDTMWVHLVVQEMQASGMPLANAIIYSMQGKPILMIRGLQARPASSELFEPPREDLLAHSLYRLEWVPRAQPLSAKPSLAGQWLVLADDAGLGQALANELAKEQGTDAPAIHVLKADPLWDLDQMAAAIDQAICTCSPESLHGIVDLWHLNAAGAPLAAGAATMTLLQQLTQREIVPKHGTWLVTREGSTIDPMVAVNPDQTCLWGLCCSARHEAPELDIRLCDLSKQTLADDLQSLLTVIKDSNPHPYCHTQKSEIWHRQLRRIEPPPVPLSLTGEIQSSDIKPDRTYLVTGATGALGAHVLRWLVKHGAKHLALVARGAPSAAQQDDARRLEALGVEMRWLTCDISQASMVHEQLAHELNTMKPLAGVVHCAGVLNDAPLQRMHWRDVESVMAGKTLGAKHLSEITQSRALDFFVMFSSAASVLGNAGQIAYAMANAYLDGLAQQRRAMGLPAISINWGPWAGAGMASSDQAVKRQLANQGFTPLTAEAALRTLDYALTSDSAQITALDCNWATYASAAPASSALIAELAAQATPKSPATGSSDNAPQFNLANMPAQERSKTLTQLVHQVLEDILGVNQADLQPQTTLMALGLDSLMAVQLRNRLSATLARPLPVSLAFNYPTIGELTAFLDDLFASDTPPSDSKSDTNTAQHTSDLLDELDKLLQS
jgi:myxalamid-type polyketide synthase MxaB